MEIKNFEELVRPILKTGQRFMSYDCKNLLPAGENYGSVMLQVQVKILNVDDKEEIIQCVAKTAPPPGFLWELFDTKVTFKKEIAVYNTIVPALNEFGKENGVDNLMDFVAGCLGARISLDERSNEVDVDAVLVLENLKASGYDVGDRFVGFDMTCAKLVLRDLATMHAAPISYKFAKPGEFKAKILPHLSKTAPLDMSDEDRRGFVKSVLNSIAQNPKCLQYSSKVEETLYNMEKFPKFPKIFEIFATITHNDFWVNNTMLKYENNKPVKNKIVDFQIVEYGSLANDVIFFLYTSVQLSVLETHGDELIKFYFENFVETLVKLHCNVTEYTLENMLEEFAIAGRDVVLARILFILGPMMTLKGEAKTHADVTMSDMVAAKSHHENYYKRIQFVVLEFGRKGWM